MEFKERTKQGYEIIALVQQPFLHENGNKAYHAVAKREHGLTGAPDYVVCLEYYPEDGSWGSGVYVNTYDSAMNVLKQYI